ncbi:MAG: hypothetical protein AAGI38_02820 [Bacteroidota bacterium]
MLLLISCDQSNDRKEEVVLEKGESVYVNHFTESDTTFWTGNDGIHYGEVRDGYYYFEALDSSRRFNAPRFDIQSEDNFSVESSIIGPTSDNSSYYGLVIGGYGAEKDFLEVSFNNSGKYKIDKGKRTKINSGNFNMGDQGDFKKLKVLKKGTTCYFYLNDERVFTYELEKLMEFRCGPITAKNSAVWMDYLKIEKETVR